MEAVAGASAIAGLLLLGAKLTFQAQTFVTRIKNASQDVTHIVSDLQSLVSILGSLKSALNDPARRNVFNAMNGSSDFDLVIEELMSVFKRFESLMQKFSKIHRSRVQKAKWGWGGESEALILGRTLGTHKTTLLLTLQLTNTLALSSIGGGIDDRLRQTEGNTQHILFRLRELSGASASISVQDNSSPAVRSWLEQVTSYAGSVVGDDDEAERLVRHVTHAGSTLGDGDTIESPSADESPAADCSSGEKESAFNHSQQTTGPLNDGGRIAVSQKTLDKAWNLIENNDASRAENILQQALKGHEMVPDVTDKNALIALRYLGIAYFDQGSEKTLAGYKKIGALDDKDALATMNNLGRAYRNQQKYKEAEATFSEALAGYKKIGALDDKKALSAMNNLGVFNQNQQKYKEAEATFSEALAGYEKIGALDGKNALGTCYNLGLVLKYVGKLTESREMLQRAHSGYEIVLGPQNEWTVKAADHLERLKKM